MAAGPVRVRPGSRFLDPNHPYAGDLDIFGHGSLFQLVCAARTSAGESTLASWFLQPSTEHGCAWPARAVDELRPKLDLREDMALLGEDVRSGLHADALRAWGSGKPVVIGAFARYAAIVLAILTPLAFVAFLLQRLPLSPFLVGVLLEIALLMQLGPKLTQIFAGAELPASDLRLLADVLERFERSSFETPLLRDLRQHLETDGLPASRQIARLRRIVEYHDWGRNQAFAPIALVLLWHAHLGFAVERWRVRWGHRIADWIQAVGEIEALSSIAGYAAEHPEDVWPDFMTEGPLFEGRAIDSSVARGGRQQRSASWARHASSGRQRIEHVGEEHDAALGWTERCACMGGDAGSREELARVSPLTVGASMRVQDSIQDGKSRFYAEITRLRQIMDLSTGSVPLLFLFDELLSGTNSHDRRIGAEAIVRSLFDTGAVGLVTTHDLALAGIAGRLAPHAANVHFEDHVEDGRISFDYSCGRALWRRAMLWN